MDLEELMRIVVTHWRMTPDRYPFLGRLEDADVGTRTAFKRRHVLFHLQKAVSGLAALEERLDHDPHAQVRPERKELVVKLLAGLLQLAYVSEIAPSELSDGLTDMYRKTPP